MGLGQRSLNSMVRGCGWHVAYNILVSAKSNYGLGILVLCTTLNRTWWSLDMCLVRTFYTQQIYFIKCKNKRSHALERLLRLFPTSKNKIWNLDGAARAEEDEDASGGGGTGNMNKSSNKYLFLKIKQFKSRFSLKVEKHNRYMKR